MRRVIVTMLIAIVGAFWSVLACETPPPRPVAPVDVVPIPEDAGSEEPTLDAARFPECALACTHLRLLGCEEGRTPDGGLSCYAICAKAEASGTFTLKPACVAAAPSKEALRKCGTVRCGVK